MFILCYYIDSSCHLFVHHQGNAKNCGNNQQGPELRFQRFPTAKLKLAERHGVRGIIPGNANFNARTLLAHYHIVTRTGVACQGDRIKMNKG